MARLVTTAGGTVDTTNSWVPAGQTLVKTGGQVGRYTLTLPVDYRRLLQVVITPIGPDSAVYGANTLGMHPYVRDIDVGQGASDGTVEIQFSQDSYADAEVPSACGALITVVVAQGTVQ